MGDDLRVRANAAAAEALAGMKGVPDGTILAPIREALCLAWLDGYGAGHADATAYAVKVLTP